MSAFHKSRYFMKDNIAKADILRWCIIDTVLTFEFTSYSIAYFYKNVKQKIRNKAFCTKGIESEV